MLFISYIFLLQIILSLSALLMQCAVFKLSRISVFTIRIFSGKPIKSFNLGASSVLVGWLPTSSSVEYDVGEFSSRPLLSRLLLASVDVIVWILFALAILGASSTWHHCLTGMDQILQGVLHPLTIAPKLIGQLETVFLNSSISAAGIFCCKMIAFSLLPYGGFKTWQLARQLVDPHDKSEKLMYLWAIMGTISFLLVHGWSLIVILVATGVIPRG